MLSEGNKGSNRRTGFARAGSSGQLMWRLNRSARLLARRPMPQNAPLKGEYICQINAIVYHNPNSSLALGPRCSCPIDAPFRNDGASLDSQFFSRFFTDSELAPA